MSDEQVDLDAMIQNDRRRKRDERTKRQQQHRRQRRDYRDSRRDYDRRDRSRDDRRDNRKDRQQRDTRRNRRPQRRQRPQKQLVVESYAISATGFVSDVSLDDILKLAKGKKIINIKAFFEREDGQPLQPGKDNAMTVIINFVQKQDANQFIKEYADKKLDGKNPLVFQFRRGIVSRRPRKQQNEDFESQDNSKQVQGKKQEQEQAQNKSNN